MPQQIKCHGCGHVLYQGNELKSSEEILQMYDGRCPNCGRKLSLIPENIEVQPVEKDTIGFV